MKKIFDLNSSCGFWSPGRTINGNPLNVRECWACRFSLFGYCWLEDWSETNLSDALCLRDSIIIFMDDENWRRLRIALPPSIEVKERKAHE
jgi:hypothetical protein